MRYWGSRARGSSPRVRGKRDRLGRGRWGVGLIPARAGKTNRTAHGSRARRAHPRACGENGVVLTGPPAQAGSSPRVRGKPRRLPLHHVSCGLIPARAGKTVCRSVISCLLSAHPRACGENSIEETTGALAAGSSPRVRGKHLQVDAHRRVRRLIPARAGKTVSPWRSPRTRKAHPRACGENLCSRRPCRRKIGSSPRVRGKLARRLHPPRRGWLIPARAGKTDGGPAAGVGPGAHPRACGENPTRRGARGGRPGSSPRVRGKPFPRRGGG